MAKKRTFYDIQYRCWVYDGPHTRQIAQKIIHIENDKNSKPQSADRSKINAENMIGYANSVYPLRLT